MLMMGKNFNFPPAPRLTQEKEEGSLEYKLKLTNMTEETLMHRVTQLHWRLNEGGNEAVYQLGVGDDGAPVGLSDQDLEESFLTLAYMAKMAGCSMHIQGLFEGECGHTAEVLLKRDAHEMLTPIHATVAVAGAAGSGKSTLIGVLTSGIKDNGKGLARNIVAKHNHEVLSGSTSSWNMRTLCFNSNGTVISSPIEGNNRLRSISDTDFAKEAERVVTFVDLAGRAKYFKTFVHGIASSSPDHCIICVSAKEGIQAMTFEHLGLALSLRVPLLIIVTMTDTVSSEVLTDLLATIKKILYRKSAQSDDDNGNDNGEKENVMNEAAACREEEDNDANVSDKCQGAKVWARRCDTECNGREGVVITDDFVLAQVRASMQPSTNVGLLAADHSVEGVSNRLSQGEDDVIPFNEIIPIFCVSSVNGSGLPLLRNYLFQSYAHHRERLTTERDRPIHVHILGLAYLSDAVHLGCILSGKISVGDRLLVGPDSQGAFKLCNIKTLRVNNVPVLTAIAGQRITFTLSFPSSNSNHISNHIKSPHQSTISEPPPVHHVLSGSTAEGEGDRVENSMSTVTNAITTHAIHTSASPEISSPTAFPTPTEGPLPSITEKFHQQAKTKHESYGKDAMYTYTLSQYSVDTSIHSPSVPLDLAKSIHINENSMYDTTMMGKLRDDDIGRKDSAGMVLLSDLLSPRPQAHWEVVAEVSVLKNRGALKEKETLVIHIGAVRQSVRVVGAVGELFAFHFLYRPEYIVIGSSIVLRDGRTRGIGKVAAIRSPSLH